MNPKQQLKALADARRGVIVPGAFNAMSARLIADLGFEAIYVTGAGVTNMWFGMPDQGFMGLGDIADHTARIRDAVEVPLLVDADTGFGNAVNTYHAVRTLERAGADCIQLEDQVSPKRCGHFNGKAVIETGEMLGKIKAAVDARRDSGTLIMARTDAAAVHGFEAPIFNADELGELGYGFVLYANAALQGAVAGMQKCLTLLRDDHKVDEDPAIVAPFLERQRLVNKDFWDGLEQKYQ